ncbi:hypothetical protein MXZ32_09800 [Streptococcus uberis]|nr:hypothetical protein [Streptococcus uberis]MCK1197324.1 hypothetical protein [Streptococcus uberis]
MLKTCVSKILNQFSFSRLFILFIFQRLFSKSINNFYFLISTKKSEGFGFIVSPLVNGYYIPNFIKEMNSFPDIFKYQFKYFEFYHTLFLYSIILSLFLILLKSKFANMLSIMSIFLGFFSINKIYKGYFPKLKYQGGFEFVSRGPAYYMVLLTFALLLLYLFIILGKETNDDDLEKYRKFWRFLPLFLSICLVLSLSNHFIEYYYGIFLPRLHLLISDIKNGYNAFVDFLKELPFILIFIFMIIDEFSGTTTYIYSTNKARRDHEREMLFKNRR